MLERSCGELFSAGRSIEKTHSRIEERGILAPTRRWPEPHACRWINRVTASFCIGGRPLLGVLQLLLYSGIVGGKQDDTQKFSAVGRRDNIEPRIQHADRSALATGYLSK